MNLFSSIEKPSQSGRRDLDQFFTPQWACIELVEQFFPDLSSSDLVLEPSCGRGAFLQAIPEHIQAIGAEIDPILAGEAEANTGRRIICGDFTTVELDFQPTAIIGNPPFKLGLIEKFLKRAHDLLPSDGRCGLLLPSYAIQTPSRVMGWTEKWSLANHVVPRTLFPRMIRPLIFVMFSKVAEIAHRAMVGFALYRQAHEITLLKGKVKELLIHGAPKVTCWRAVVDWALRRLGGRARLTDLYDMIEPHRPTDNRFWCEKVRQTLQRHFNSPERGVWAI